MIINEEKGGIMVGFLIGLGFGFGLHFAWCKWGQDCNNCEEPSLTKKKK